MGHMTILRGLPLEGEMGFSYPYSNALGGPQGGLIGPVGSAGPQIATKEYVDAMFAETISVDARKRKITQAIEKAIGLLSLSICAHISGLYFDGDDPRDYKFIVLFDNDTRLEFPDIDQFPTQADIGRIALMCPY